jgi:hypothetical protein
VVVEEDNDHEPVKKQSDRKRAENNMSPKAATRASIPEHADEGEESDDAEEDEGEEEEEEEEEVYDIDE